MSKTIIIKRTGQAPLRVRGKPVASSCGGEDVVTIYLTETKRYVVSIVHGGHDGEDAPAYDAAVFTTALGCLTFLKGRVSDQLIQQLVAEME